jgi:hypothetical protein
MIVYIEILKNLHKIYWNYLGQQEYNNFIVILLIINLKLKLKTQNDLDEQQNHKILRKKPN